MRRLDETSDTSARGGTPTSDWPFVLTGIAVSALVVPLYLYSRLAVATASGGPSPFFGYLAMVPGFLMGGLGLWMAARG